MKNDSNRSAVDWVLHISKWYAVACSLIIAATGVVMLFSTFGKGRRFKWLMAESDRILEISNHTFLITAGVVHLLLAAFFLAARSPLVRGMLGGWLGANHLVYCLGMLWMRVATPYPCMHAVTMKLGTSAKTVEMGWKTLIAFLLASTVVFVLLERRRIKALKDAGYAAQWREYRREVTVEKVKRKKGGKEGDSTKPDNDSSLSTELKVACPNCGQHIRHEAGYAGNEVTCPSCKKSVRLFGAEDLKISCFFCEGHIQFPAHALGKKMPCPHCHKDITLIEPK